MRRRVGCRRRHPGASSRRSGGRGPAGRRDDPHGRLPSQRGPDGGGGRRCLCRGAGQQDPRRQARPASSHQSTRTGRSRSCRAVVRPSRPGGPCPRVGGAAETASGIQGEPADCLGHLALAEALRGRLRRAAQLAGRAALELDEHPLPGQNPSPAALVALAWVHLERYELREAHGRLKQADAALGARPDKLIGAVAHLVAAGGALAEGRAAAAAQIIARARSGWPVPAWLDQRLSLAESRACAAAGDIPASLAAAGRAGSGTSLEAAVTLAHASAAAGDGQSARRVLAPALAALSGAPDRVCLQAWLIDARLSYTSGDRERGRRSLASALRLAEPEQLRLPFVLEHGWIEPVLRHDPALARSSHQSLFSSALFHDQLPAPQGAPTQAAILVVEPLTKREREVLRHVSGLLTSAEIASEMHISTHTVKTHLKNIYRKLAATRRGEAVRRARQLELI